MGFIWYLIKQVLWLLVAFALALLFGFALVWLNDRVEHLMGWLMLSFTAVVFVVCSWGDYQRKRLTEAHNKQREKQRWPK